MKREAKVQLTGGRNTGNGFLGTSLRSPPRIYGGPSSNASRFTPHAARGFTLLELLVALLVISLGMFAAVKASGSYAANLNYLQERTFAHWVARNQLVELQLEGGVTSTSTKQDKARFADRDWSWRAEFEGTPDPDLVRVEVEVWPGLDPEGESLASLIGYLQKR